MADDRVYLSDVIEVNKFKKGQANIVVAPCHSGKTTAAVSKIAPLASYPAKVLILIDTTAGRDALAKTEEIQKYSDKWLKEIEVEWWGSLLSGDGIRVMTYHQFGYKIQENPHFLKDIEVLICDEMHNLIKYIGIEHGINKNGGLLGTKDEVSTCKKAMKEIERISRMTSDSPLLVVMTATVNAVSFAFDKDNVKTEYFDYYGKVSEDKTTQRLFYGNLERVIRNIELGEKTIVYIQRIEMIKKYAEIAEINWNNVCCLWGINNEQHPLTKEQKEVREEILKTQKVPEWIDVLFINAAYETSINIRSEEFKTMIVHSGNNDVQVQVRGRLRHDIDKLYIYDTKIENLIDYFPEEYYDKFLIADDIKQIVAFMNLHNAKGALIKWPTIVKKLQKNGVTANATKQKDIRGWILHRPA